MTGGHEPLDRKDLSMTEKHDSLAELLKEKIRIFRNFLSLTASLKEMIERENTPRIRDLLRQRREDIVRIDRLDGRIRTLRRKDSPGLFPNMERRLGSLFLELEEAVKAAVRMDKECTEGALGRLEGLRADLAVLCAGRQGFRGYGEKPSQRPRFLDVKT